MPKSQTDWTTATKNRTNWESGVDSDDASAGFLLLENGDNLLNEFGSNMELQ